MSQKYDAIIIGAGMSGIAAAIRLAMFDKKVCVLEQHSLPGGLNSYYQRNNFLFDVGLHAMTNFALPGSKKTPFGKLIKQLRIPYTDFKLNQQQQSKILFQSCELSFNNHQDFLKQEIAQKFPDQIDNYCRLLEKINSFDETALSGNFISAKSVVADFISDPLLIEMLFCPLLIYGSAWENDMDFSQFVIMFKSIFIEGFCRPQGGVRTVIDTLINRLNEVGGEIFYRHKVDKILHRNGRAYAVSLKNGTTLEASTIFSSAGLPETLSLAQQAPLPPVGKLSFTETILLTKQKPQNNNTIIFYNKSDHYKYQKPTSLFDSDSAVICFPNNFEVDDYDHGIIRITNMANFEKWHQLNPTQYRAEKSQLEANAEQTIQNVLPHYKLQKIYSDSFTPTTIQKFTGHFGGTVYGSPLKSKDGSTPINGLYICGTDQGFLGIVGSILSGISMANLHGLMK